MKRRSFINAIGGAIIGTAIALRLPDVLVPVKPFLAEPRITFQAMYDAYQKAMSESGEPYAILLSPKSLNDAYSFGSRSIFPPRDYYEPRYMHFQNATVTDSPDVQDDVIQVLVGSETKEFYFV